MTSFEYINRNNGYPSSNRLKRLLKIATGLSILAMVVDLTSSRDETFSKFLRRLCELDTVFNEGIDDDDYGVWTETFETGTIDYYEQGKEPPSQLAIEKSNDVAIVLTLLECPELPDGAKPGVPEDAPDSDMMYDEISQLSYSVCEECGVVMIEGNVYNTTLYAMIPGDAIECMGSNGQTYDRVKMLQELGFIVDIVGSPIKSEEIQDTYLRNNVELDVGKKDLIKLNAFNYTTHPVVVLIDYSTFVTKPLHDTFSAFSSSTRPAAVTMDYSPYDATPTANNRGINTGLIFIKPDKTELENILNLYRTSSYDPTNGWGNSGIGGFPGSCGTSGILTYYYSLKDPQDQPMILDQCLYNNDNQVRYNIDGKCRDRDSSEPQTCRNCQVTHVADIVAGRMHNNMDADTMLNTGACEKPYNCLEYTSRVCNYLYGEWFTKRLTFEALYFHKGGTRAVRNEAKSVRPRRDKGYCYGTGRQAYQKILPEKPTGPNPKKEPVQPDVGLTCPNTCESGQYLTSDCTCTSDECAACPQGTSCTRKNGDNPPMCIDCSCGFCDYQGDSCCDFNGVDSCKSVTNKKECLMHNGYYPAWSGLGSVCSGNEIIITSTVPNGCGCQPSESKPCTYDRSLQSQEEKCIVTRADELLTSKHADMTSAAVSVATTCRDCIVNSCGEICPDITGDGQADVHAMQKCLGNTIGNDACRQSCASECNYANVS